MRNLLVHTVLASTIFVAPSALGTPFGPGSTAGTVLTSAQPDNIVEVLGGTVTTAGQIQGNNTIAISIDSTFGQVFVDSNNASFGVNAVSVIGSITPANTVSMTGNNPSIIINAGSGVTNTNTQASNINIAINGKGNAVIDNFGTVSSIKGSAVTLSGVSGSGVISNNQGGILLNLSNFVPSGTISLQQNAEVINAGRIDALGTATAIGISASAEITNTGTIFASAPNVTVNNAAITALASGKTITLTNYGNITNGVFNASAIDFQAALNNATITQAGGLISGNILLSEFDSNGAFNTFYMTGGVIDGNVIENTTIPNAFTMSGGTINGMVQLGTNGIGGLGDLVNFSGGMINQLLGSSSADTYNVSGGNIIQLIGNGGTDTLNVNGNFTSTIISGIKLLNISNPGTLFTVNGPITTLGLTATINPNTAMIVNAPITGNAAVNNGGLVLINSTWVTPATVSNLNGGIFQVGPMGQLIAAFFENYTGASFEPILYPINNYAQINVTSASAAAANLINGSFVAPQLVIGQFYPQNTRFDVISATSTGGGITDNSTLIQPASVILGLNKAILGGLGAPQTLSITVHRNPYSSQSLSSQTQGVAIALDNFAMQNPTDPSILMLMGTLDFDATTAQLQNDLASLTPPANWGLVQGSLIGMDIISKLVMPLMGDMHMLNHEGQNYGDTNLHEISIWGSVLGAHVNQQERDVVSGYYANAGGFALGTDWRFSECALIGAVASYTKANVDGKGSAPKDQAIKSWQGSIYGWYVPLQDIFVDAMLGIASQHFNINRVITFNAITTGASAAFDGMLYGLMGDIGYALWNHHDVYVAPLIRLKYSHLQLNDYAESGAGGLNLTVLNDDFNEFSGGVGFRSAATMHSANIRFIPEFSAIFSYDFIVDNEQTTASFLGGGPGSVGFATAGIEPGRIIVDVELGLNAYFNAYSLIVVQYDLQLRDQYVGNSGFVKGYYFW